MPRMLSDYMPKSSKVIDKHFVFSVMWLLIIIVRS